MATSGLELCRLLHAGLAAFVPAVGLIVAVSPALLPPYRPPGAGRAPPEEQLPFSPWPETYLVFSGGLGVIHPAAVR